MKNAKRLAGMLPGKSRVVRVRVDSLGLHQAAQRAEVKAKTKKMAEEMDLDAIGVLHAVEYPIDGVTKLWVIDGQHRVNALLSLGFGEWIVEVKVHMDIKNEAAACALFLKLNERAAVSSFDKFDKEVKAKEEVAVAIVEVLARHGLSIARSAGDGKLNCVVALKNLWRKDSGASLSATLSVCSAAWGTGASTMEGKIIEGVGIVVARYLNIIEKETLAKKLAKYPGGPPGLLGDAKGLKEYRKSSLARCVGERVVETYNSGRRSGKLELL